MRYHLTTGGCRTVLSAMAASSLGFLLQLMLIGVSAAELYRSRGEDESEERQQQQQVLGLAGTGHEASHRDLQHALTAIQQCLADRLDGWSIGPWGRVLTGGQFGGLLGDGASPGSGDPGVVVDGRLMRRLVVLRDRAVSLGLLFH